MKKLLTAIIILLSFNGYGQDSTGEYIYIDSNKVYWSTQKKSYVLDTIKVIILVCDTTPTKFDTKFTIYRDETNGYKIGESINHVPYVFWKTAYSVREKHCCINGYTGIYALYQPEPYYIHQYYLDDKKQSLSKNIIVWQSIETK